MRSPANRQLPSRASLTSTAHPQSTCWSAASLERSGSRHSCRRRRRFATPQKSFFQKSLWDKQRYVEDHFRRSFFPKRPGPQDP